MVVAQRANTLRRPDLPMCRAALIPIQDGGDSHIWFDPRQRANDLHEILVGDISMFAAANLLELYLSVIPSLPMQHEPYGFTLACGDDLLQRDAKESLLVLRRTLRIVPKSGEIPRELQQLPFLCVAEWTLATLLQGRELGFELRLCGQRLIPSTLELRCDEPIRRIHGIILASRVGHFITGVL